MTAKYRTPSRLGVSGQRLFKETVAKFGGAMGESERQILLRAAFIADMLDRLEKAITAKGLFDLIEDKGKDRTFTVRVDGALTEYRQQANVLKQLLASLRIPDETGTREQRRGANRGAYTKRAGNVTPIDRAQRYGKATTG